MTTTLVLGGVRSGKSRHAEDLLRGFANVTCVAPGAGVGEPAPAGARTPSAPPGSRPDSWATLESVDIASAIRQAPGPVIVDCLGSWLTRLLDELGGWGDPVGIQGWLAKARADLQTAISEVDRNVVLVSDEVGLGPMPTTPTGRIFRDELAVLNADVGSRCDQVHLVVAGRVLDLSKLPVVGLEHALARR
jgi:adenosylcobinamide kinase/adenosylcobinamide-phosphate guanylyltransferase